MEIDYVAKKAELTLGGDITIPAGYTNPLFELRNGEPHSMVLTFGNTRVRKMISQNGEFSFCPRGDTFDIKRNGELFLENVGLKQMFCHSPDMAVVSIYKAGHLYTMEEIEAQVDAIASRSELKGISLHASLPCTLEHYMNCISTLHTKYPDVKIGVSRDSLTKSEMEEFVGAGASNFKITVQSFIPALESIIDPGVDLDEREDYLREAVEVFGRSNVSVTTYMGMGETDEEILSVVRKLCSMGVLPDVKVKKKLDPKRSEIERKLERDISVSPERYADLMRAVNSIVLDSGLEPDDFPTLCYGCRCCCLVPKKDFISIQQ